MNSMIFQANKRIRFVILFCIILQSSVFAQGFSPETRFRLQFVIDSFQNNPANPYVGGMSAAIIVDGLASWKGATGYAVRNVDAQNNLLPGGTQFKIGTLSRMYSVTKTFTAALVLELAKEHAFKLSDPVSKFLPLNLINPQLNSAVTIRQLLSHESGYSNYTDELQLQIAVAAQPTHIWTPVEMLTFVHQVSAPGSERRYSSTNYIVLGAIMEIATGKPVEKHYRKRFFKPLHLNSMFLDVREPLKNGATLAAPHDNISPFNPVFQATGQPTFPDAYTNISIFPLTAIMSLAFTGGGIITNVEDMAEWGNALFDGRATSKTTINTMINSISPTPDPDGDYLGYGIFRTTKISTTDIFIGHDGNAPGYRSVMFYQPDKKMTIAILTNYHGANLYDVAKILYESLPEFTCSNKPRKEDKILICSNGHTICLDRHAAAIQIKRGAWLGGCPPENETECRSIARENVTVADHNSMNIFPNPATDRIAITFKTSKAGKVTIGLYDMNGKLVATIFNGLAEKDILQKVEFTTSKLSPGIYFTCLQIQGEIQQHKLVLTR